MKEKTSSVRWILLFLVLIFLFFPMGKQDGSFQTLSKSFFRKLFETEKAREVFSISREEAIEVFGETEKGDFV